MMCIKSALEMVFSKCDLVLIVALTDIHFVVNFFDIGKQYAKS